MEEQKTNHWTVRTALVRRRVDWPIGVVSYETFRVLIECEPGVSDAEIRHRALKVALNEHWPEPRVVRVD